MTTRRDNSCKALSLGRGEAIWARLTQSPYALTKRGGSPISPAIASDYTTGTARGNLAPTGGDVRLTAALRKDIQLRRVTRHRRTKHPGRGYKKHNAKTPLHDQREGQNKFIHSFKTAAIWRQVSLPTTGLWLDSRN